MANSKVYLNVPYAEKDAAKTLGAKWDPAKKKWYAPADKDETLFLKWQGEAAPLDSKAKRTKSATTTTKNPLRGVTTYPKDKNFIAYSGERPPWEE